MISDSLVPRLLGPRGLGRLLWWLEHAAKDSSLGQARQGVEKAVLLLDREDELIPTHVPPPPTPYSHPISSASLYRALSVSTLGPILALRILRCVW